MNKRRGRCVIMAGGLWTDEAYHRQILTEAETVIGADRGAGFALALGVTPHYAVGDFDSLSRGEYQELKKQGVVLQQYPCAKDYPDSYYALTQAVALGYRQITLLAALGGRFDHAYANMMLLVLPEVRDLDVRLDEPEQEIFFLKPKMKIKGQKGETLSLLPLSVTVTGITTTGLYYPVPRGEFQMGYPLGVSNVFVEEVVKISYQEGLLVAIHPKKEKSGYCRFLP